MTEEQGKTEWQGMTEEQFTTLRNITRQKLFKACAAEISSKTQMAAGRGILEAIVEMRVVTEQLSVDVNTLVLALLSTETIDEKRFAITALQIMQERVTAMEESQSRLILATARNGKLS